MTTTPDTASPTPGTYAADVTRSRVTSNTRHMFGLGQVTGTFGLGQVTGTFALRAGSIARTEPIEQATARATIDDNQVTGMVARRLRLVLDLVAVGEHG